MQTIVFFQAQKLADFAYSNLCLIWRHTAVQKSISKLSNKLTPANIGSVARLPVMNGMCTLQKAY